MKRFYARIANAVLVVGITLTTIQASAQFSGGNGTENDPYVITSPGELLELATYVNQNNASYNNKHYKLANDIDLSAYGENYNGGAGWILIGKYTTGSNDPAFKGVFDGDDYIISNLFINNKTVRHVGLFGLVINGTIKNVSLENVNVTSSNSGSGAISWAGGVIGWKEGGSLTNCYSTGAISSTSTYWSSAGGLVGGNTGNISDSYSTASVLSNSPEISYAGGVVGLIYPGSNVTYCNSSGNVTCVCAGDFAPAGGVVGYNYSGTVSCCYSTGTVTSHESKTAMAGGVVGYMYGGHLMKSYFTGTAKSDGTSQSFAGGILGYNTMDGDVSNCYSFGSITAMGVVNTFAGGIMGYSFIGNLSNCYSTGVVSAFGPAEPTYETLPFVGGVIGGHSDMSDIINCAALNSDLVTSNQGAFARIGQGNGLLSNNIGYTGMIDPLGETTWFYEGEDQIDGEDIAVGEIHADGTLGSRFTEENGWTTEEGKLPGLFGEAIDMPNHLRLPEPPYIITKNLPNGTVGELYNQTLEAEGDTPITWVLEDGELPDDLVLSEDGIISGTPAVAGTFTFTVKATNNVSFDTQKLSIIIKENGNPPVITTENLPDGEVGELYNQTLVAEGDTPITWVLEDGDLPDDLVLSEDGIISGTPTAAGTFTFTVKATNNVSFDTQDLSIIVKEIGNIPKITTENLPEGKVDVEYNQILTADGDTPIIWSLVDESILPDGLELSADGVISGIPTEEGTFDFTIKATNDFGFDTKDFSILIKPYSGISNNPFTQTLKAYSQNGSLYISGLTVGEKWYVIDLSGRIIYEGIATSLQKTQRVDKGVYIIKSGNRTALVVNE